MSESASRSEPLSRNLAASRIGSASVPADPYDLPVRRLHGLCRERQEAARLRRALIAHVGGKPSATQAAMIDQGAELKLRLAVMDQDFIQTGRRSAHASRDYLAWSNSLVRLLRQLGLKGQPERGPTLAEIMATAPAPRARTAPAAVSRAEVSAVSHAASASPDAP